jgi:nicotinamide riboside kinase
MEIKRIAIDGPESTGKSELATFLAFSFNAAVVPEMARTYLEQLGRHYHQNDLLEIARLQCKAEDDAAGKHMMIFCDTTLLVIKIWSEFKYGNCHPWIEEEYLKRKYDLHILTNIDLPWQEDPLREHPMEREILFEKYHFQMITAGINYEIVTGTGKIRQERALAYCKKYFTS